jgi:hypothetical protein
MCISDYILSLNGLILFLIIVYQLYNYRKIYQVPSSDRRIQILIICLFSSLYSGIRYSTFISVWKGKTFFMVEIFHFVIFFADCYYFCSKSSNLLPNKEYVKWLLKVIFTFLFALCFGFMIYIFVLETRGEEIRYNGRVEIKNQHLCTSSIFLSARWISAALCVIFGTIFFKIRRRSLAIM